MQQAEFESLLFVDVEEYAAAEHTPPEGKPKYHGRPWTQLRDEMLAAGAMSVAELPDRAIEIAYRSTKAAHRGVRSTLRGLFGGGA
jgi:hypothetical protein